MSFRHQVTEEMPRFSDLHGKRVAWIDGDGVEKFGRVVGSTYQNGVTTEISVDPESELSRWHHVKMSPAEVRFVRDDEGKSFKPPTPPLVLEPPRPCLVCGDWVAVFGDACTRCKDKRRP